MDETQIEKIQMETEQLENQINKKHCLIAVIVTFLIIVTGIAAFSLYHFVTDNQKSKHIAWKQTANMKSMSNS